MTASKYGKFNGLSIKMNYLFRWISGLCLCLFLFSCGTSKYLTEDQSLLRNNKLKIQSSITNENVESLRKELETFYRQKPNTKFMFLFPREWYHFATLGDSAWYHNWARNYLGEEPTIFLESEAFRTAEGMQKYLRNKKGFYQADVSYSLNTHKKSTTVNYLVKTKEQSTIASLDYIGEDEQIVKTVQSFSDESALRIGGPIEAGSFDREKNRIATKLQNLGYANFVPNYINIIGDSTNHPTKIDVLIEIRNPGVEQKHKQYVIGDINVFTDYYQGQDQNSLESESLHGLIFKRAAPTFFVKPSRLKEKIKINSGDLYRRIEQNATFRKLSSLKSFRFVNISPSISTQSDSIIDVNVFLTPFNKKWILDLGGNAFYSNIAASGRRLFGFSVDGSLKNRNMFGGAEQFQIEGELGYEFDFSPIVKTSAITGNLQTSLEIPKVIDPLKSMSALRKLGIFSKDNYKSFLEETTTRLSLGYSQTNIIDFYNLRSISASFGYDFRPSPRHTFLIRTAGINFNDYQLDVNFLSRINNNPLILSSFESNYFTGFLFRSLSYLYQSNKKPSGFSWSQILRTEVSGWEILLANKIIEPDKVWRFNNNYDYAQFFKFEADTRFYQDVGKNSSLAFRASGGIAFPLRANQAVPFIQQFYVGGPNSIRAWQLRELGPGSYSDLLINPVPNQLFYQQGDIKLEMNLEYRFDLLWYFDGAIFFDAGNVWTRKEDPNRPGAKFSRNFYRDIAVGTGWGLRMDFEYFLIRFDFGYRLRNPYPDPKRGNYWQPLSTFKFLGNVNIAINYPF